MQKPKHERKSLPTAPSNLEELITGKASVVAAYNEEAFTNYNENALDACPNCARTFLPDSLKIHLRSCNKAFGRSAEIK